MDAGANQTGATTPDGLVCQSNRRNQTGDKQKEPDAEKHRALKKTNLRFVGVDADASLAFGTFKLDLAGDQGIDSVVSTDANVDARVELGAALPNDNVPGLNDLAAILLDAKHLWLGISTVTG